MYRLPYFCRLCGRVHTCGDSAMSCFSCSLLYFQQENSFVFCTCQAVRCYNRHPICSTNTPIGLLRIIVISRIATTPLLTFYFLAFLCVLCCCTCTAITGVIKTAMLFSGTVLFTCYLGQGGTMHAKFWLQQQQQQKSLTIKFRSVTAAVNSGWCANDKIGYASSEFIAYADNKQLKKFLSDR